VDADRRSVRDGSSIAGIGDVIKKQGHRHGPGEPCYGRIVGGALFFGEFDEALPIGGGGATVLGYVDG
jgi:hypothetical protein